MRTIDDYQRLYQVFPRIVSRLGVGAAGGGVSGMLELIGVVMELPGPVLVGMVLGLSLALWIVVKAQGEG